MATNIVLSLPHDGQMEVYQSDARYRVLSCGRRWGKTKLMQILAVQKAIKDGQPVGWFAPNYKYLGIPYKELLECLSPIVIGKNHERFIALANGVRIDFWTLEDENAGRGFKYGRAVIDEAGMAPNLEEAWNNAIRPTLTDYSGDAIFGGTPKGRNFFYKLFRRGLDDVDGWASFQKPTSTNPTLPPREWDRESLLASGYPERSYDQEYMAEFLDDAGGVFIGVRDVVDAGRSANESPRADRSYYAGLDLAQSEDWTVLVIFDEEGRQVYFDRFHRITWSLTVERIANALREYRALCVVDATGVGQPIYEALHQQSLKVQPFKFTAQSKARLVERAVATIQRKDIRLMDITDQTEELVSYEYEVTKSGNVRMNAPLGMHDDCVIAVCLGISALERPAFTVLI